MAYQTKPGKYGPLYLFEIAYVDTGDAGNAHTTRMWAYDTEHAHEKFYESNSEGWKIQTVKMLKNENR